MMFDLTILILVSWRSSPVLHTFESQRKTLLALPNLLQMSCSAPPELLTMAPR